MKERIAFLLILFGGVVGGFASRSVSQIIPSILIELVGGFLIGFSLMLFTSVYSGTVWGIKIPAKSSSGIKKLIGVSGLFLGGFSLVLTFLTVVVSLFNFKLVEIILNLAAFIIPLVIGPFVAKKYLEKDLAKGNSASVLGDLEIFKEIDANLDQAVNFVVGFEGVALFSKTNYCYAIYKYEDYQLGELSTPEEVALVGTYFVQKYNDRFTFKVDVETIPGEPGHTVVAVGTGGIGVARVQGTPNQHLFRSYIFYRK